MLTVEKVRLWNITKDGEPCALKGASTVRGGGHAMPTGLTVPTLLRRGAGRKGGLADLARGLPYLVPRCGSWRGSPPALGHQVVSHQNERSSRNRKRSAITGVGTPFPATSS